MFDGFSLLRPMWLLGLIPLAGLVWWWWRESLTDTLWDGVVDKELQRYVIEPPQHKRHTSAIALFAGWCLCLLVLAGPVWEQRPVPLYSSVDSSVILFDLSNSMYAEDVKPNRLTRAVFKLKDVFEQSAGQQLGLVAFSERPYVISPLTDDFATIESFLPSMSPEVMPIQGSRVDLAIFQGIDLLKQSGVSAGHLLLVTDATISSRDVTAAKAARKAGHIVSVMGVGTAQGAPLRDTDGKFIKNSSGAVVVPKLDVSGLKKLSATGGGSYIDVKSDQLDLHQLALNAMNDGEKQTDIADQQGSYWIERGPYLVVLLAILSLALFRRGLAW
ncbi:MAG: VWA domain-containing protein [Gammaproteobacteria bacterium]|nr:VWA domain-containing protein [Gammaproteobacteria bacterium]